MPHVFMGPSSGHGPRYSVPPVPPLSVALETCARKRPVQTKDKVQLHPIPIVGEFAQEWVCDVLGPTLKPTARRRNKHILVCVDQATRFTQLFALRNLQTHSDRRVCQPAFSKIWSAKKSGIRPTVSTNQCSVSECAERDESGEPNSSHCLPYSHWPS